MLGDLEAGAFRIRNPFSVCGRVMLQCFHLSSQTQKRVHLHLALLHSIRSLSANLDSLIQHSHSLPSHTLSNMKCIVATITSIFLFSTAFARPERSNATTSLQKRNRPSIVTTCRKSGQFALTFDDGPYDHENEMSNKLSKANAKGTFFVNGNNWECIYDQAETLQETYRQGHLIG